jgi:putative nucleotidyltransferase with HDIG domain
MASINPSNIAAVQGGGGLELLVVEVDKLVSLPDIYYRLEETIVDPTSTMEVIANLLRSDPDLCARMLRMANSAFYSFPTRIETIERAVGTIGLRQIRELVLITAVVKAFEGIPPGTVNMETFWEHSLAVGIMARELGRQAGLPNADGFYIPGLLHDIGRLVMYLKLPGLMRELLERHEAERQSLFLMEREILNYSHADIGARLLELWNLPQSIWEPVSKHHEPGQSDEYQLSACAIHIADAWVNTHRIGRSGDSIELLIDEVALRRIDIDSERVSEIGQMARQQTREVARLFMSH